LEGEIFDKRFRIVCRSLGWNSTCVVIYMCMIRYEENVENCNKLRTRSRCKITEVISKGSVLIVAHVGGSHRSNRLCKIKMLLCISIYIL
jgi:hypothetical protein